MPNQKNPATQPTTAGTDDFTPITSAGSDMDELQTSADEVKDSAKNLLAQAKSTAGDAYESVADKATAKIEEHKAGLSGGLTNVADSIRKAADSLNEAGQPNYVTEYSAQYAHTAAEKVEKIARYFETQDLKGIARDTEDLARRNPALFLGGAFAIGIVVARLLKSTPLGTERYADTSVDTVPYIGGETRGRSDAGLNAM